jgi:hypothetical protein
MVAATREANPGMGLIAAHSTVQSTEEGRQAYSQHLAAKGITRTTATGPATMVPRLSSKGSAVDEYRQLVQRERAAGMSASAAHRTVMNTAAGEAAYRRSLMRRGIIVGHEVL